MKEDILRFLFFLSALSILLMSFKIYQDSKNSSNTFFKTSNAAVFVYKNGIETDSYTTEIKVSKEHAGFLRIEENKIVKVYFDMNGENKWKNF